MKEFIQNEIDTINNDNCMDYMKIMPDECVNLTLTDIPYGVVNRDSNGLRNLNKEDADIMTFELQDFLEEVYRVTSGTIIIFCSREWEGKYQTASGRRDRGSENAGSPIWKTAGTVPG